MCVLRGIHAHFPLVCDGILTPHNLLYSIQSYILANFLCKNVCFKTGGDVALGRMHKKMAS